MFTPDPHATRTAQDDEEMLVWRALLSAAGWARREEGHARAYGLDSSGCLQPLPVADSRTLIIWQEPNGWIRSTNAPSAVRALLDLYLPICNASRKTPLTVGHLGQGLDGYIANPVIGQDALGNLCPRETRPGADLAVALEVALDLHARPGAESASINLWFPAE